MIELSGRRIIPVVTVSALAWLGLAAGCSDSGDSKPSGAAGSDAGSGLEGGSGAGAAGQSGAGGSGTGGSGTGGSGATGGSDSAAAEAFFSSFAKALCHRYFHCVDVDDHNARSRLKAVAKSEDRCTATLKDVLLTRPRTRVLSQAIAERRLHVQAEWVDRCLAVASRCQYPSVNPEAGTIMPEDVPPCREVFEGTVATGGDCDLSEQCAGDAMCVRTLADAGATPCSGTCRPRLDPGAACSVDQQCASPIAEWPICQNNVCALARVLPPLTQGQQCTGTGQVCSDDLFCAPNGNCEPASALDSACDPNIWYARNCLDGRCVGTACTAYTVRSAAGESCASGEVCDSFAGLGCNGSTCVRAASAMPCTTTYSFFWFERAICPVSRAATGAACTKSDDCESGICRYPNGCAASLCAAN